MYKKLLISVLILVLGVMLTAAQDNDEEMSEPQMSYQICDWGLLTIETPAEQRPIFIEIDSPADYSAVDSTFTLSGTGAGLFEGNVIVEVTEFGGDQLFEGFTVLQAEEMGGEGDWSIEVDLGDIPERTQIFVTVFSTSPADGSTTALDTLRLNANAEFGLRFVEITTPTFGAGVNSSPLLIEGMAGSAFENNIVIEVTDFETGDVLVETFATVDTDELGGSGPFSAEVTFDAEPGTAIEVRAYHPQIAETDAEISNLQFAIVSPLGQSYERYLNVQRDDIILGAEELCAVTEAEFENENAQPLVINDVTVISTRSMMPLVNVSIEAAGSSNCPAPLRARTVRDGDTFNIEVYLDITDPVPCTADLAPIPVRVSLGTLESPDFSVTVNGEAVE